MPKFTMPNSADFNKYFLAKKTLYGPKKEPVWVYLEREMLENVEKKPYNEKVGEWLVFLKELKLFFYHQSKKQEKTLIKEIGPSWYMEMSGMQKEILRNMMASIYHDLIEGTPQRTRKALSDLGLMRNIPKCILMETMAEAGGDSAVFFWKLYTAIYKRTPSEPRKEYDMDAMVLMSALVFIDLEECLQNLKELTKPAKQEAPEPKKKEKKPRCSRPKIRYGMYLEKCKIPLYCNNASPQRGQRVKKPPPKMEKKISVRSDKSYERLRLDDAFIDKRLERSKKSKQDKRICTYKFWEPPTNLHNRDPRMAEYSEKLKLLSKKAIMNHATPLRNMEFNVGPVVLVGGRLRYLLNNMCTLPTGYIPVRGGTRHFASGDDVTIIAGAWKFPIDKEEKCDNTCDCLEKWKPAVLKHLENSKCKCGHLYDLKHEGKSREKYFYPPTKHAPLWFDNAKIFQMDPMEDFIKETVRLAVMSEEPTPEPSHPGLSAGGLNLKALLQSLLADLSHTPLVIPHLPQANLLNNLLEWVRRRFKGKLTPYEDKQAKLKSLRRWLWLKHMDFRKRAYMIPLTRKEIEHMTWAYRQNVQSLKSTIPATARTAFAGFVTIERTPYGRPFKIYSEPANAFFLACAFETLLEDFTTRNRVSQLKQTRLWWSTMQYDKYPDKSFSDIYYTYLPGRMKDVCLFNPYSSERTPKNIYKTCPLS